MSEIIITYALLTLFINLMWWLIFAPFAFDTGLCFCNPLWIYDHAKTNWFGTICLAILANVAFGPSAIIYWFYKLCTVGRE